MNLKVGNKVRCTHAETAAYRVGEVYDVVKDPVTSLPAIKAREGFLDLPDIVLSKFEIAKEGARASLEVVK